MKITKEQLEEIIKEEIDAVLGENNSSNIAELEKQAIDAIMAGRNNPSALQALTKMSKLGKYNMNRLKSKVKKAKQQKKVTTEDIDEQAYYEMLAEGETLEEAEYQGRKVTLNKPMRGDVKKSKVYVKNAKGNVVKVNFGDPNMKIRKSNPKARKSFRARHNCDNPGPKWKARYWSCKAW